MRFAPTEDQIEFAAAVRSLLADTCTPADVAASWGGEVGRHTGLGEGDGRVGAAWAALAEMGVLGLTVPEANGGLGMGLADLVVLLAECGGVALPDPVGDTAGVVAPLLAEVAGDDSPASAAAQRWLSDIAGGAAVVSGFGSGAPVVSATSADAFVLFSHDPRSHDPRGTGASDDARVVLSEPSEVELVRLESVDGSRGLARVEASGGVVLAEGPRAVAATASAFDRAAVMESAVLVGLSQAMLAMTVEYVSQRKQFGVPVGSFQAVKHQLADAGSAVAFTEPLVAHAAHLLDGGTGALGTSWGGDDDVVVAVSMAKARASTAAQQVSETALQAHGAIGYTVEADLHLFMKRAWALARSHGDAAWHRRRIRKRLLGS